MPIDSRSGSSLAARPGVPLWLRIAFALALVAALALSFWLYRHQEDAVRVRTEANLQAVAQLKVQQISHWRTERLNSAADMMASLFIIDAIDHWLRQPRVDELERLLFRLRALQKREALSDVMFVDSAGRQRLSLTAQSNGPCATTQTAILQAMRERQPRLTDLHMAHDGVHIDAIAPMVTRDGRTIGALILHNRASNFLYPMLQAWPTPSPSAETLLVRREGDQVLFLSEMRQRRDSALKLTVPLSRSDAPSVQAVLGRSGIFEGTDHRGVAVVTVLRAIPDSPWFMVTKIDKREVYADWRARSALLLALLAALVVAMLAGALWLRSRATHERNLRQAEAALRLDREHQATLRQLLEIVIKGAPLTETLGRCLDQLLALPWLSVLPRGGVHLMAPDGQGLELTVARNLPPDLVRQCQHLPLGRCLCGMAAAQGQVQFTPHVDTRHEIRYTGMEDHGHYCLPLMANQEVLGVLVLYLRAGAGQDPVQQTFLAAVANILAGCIQARRADTELERHRLHLDDLVAERTVQLQQADARLAALNAELAHAQGIAQVGSWRLDIPGNHLTWSDETYRIFGLPLGQPLSLESFAACIHPDDLERVFSAWGAALHGAPYDIEHRIVVGAQIKWVRERAIVSFDTAGQALAGLGAVQDITELKLAEAATLQALADAQQLAQVKSAFLANMSHEIRTPLNAVLGLAQIGVRDSTGREAQTGFQQILDSGQHLLAVINDILDFSKIEAGKLGIEQAPFLLGEVIDRAIGLNAASAYAKGLTLHVSEALDLPEGLNGDAIRITQILVNLLSNAIKFTERGAVSLAVTRADGWLLMRVSDSGIGMTREQLERLFQPFEQADTSTTRRYGGSGLGLAISARLASAMDGTLEADSTLGAGAQFTLRLPLLAPSPASPCAFAGPVRLVGLPPDEGDALAADLRARGMRVETRDLARAYEAPLPARLVIDLEQLPNTVPPAGSALWGVHTPGTVLTLEALPIRPTMVLERPLRARHVCLAAPVAEAQGVGGALRLAGVRVLAAEDIAINRLVLEDILRQEGAQVTFAENGSEAVEHLRAQGAAAFDVVLMDIQMPVMDGYTATREIHALAPALAVIGLTAHALAEERERCLAAGMIAHVSKPIDIDTLVAAILGRATPAQAVAPAPATTPPAAMVDWTALKQRHNGREAFLAKLCDIALNTYADLPEKLDAAARQGDIDAISFLAHSIKGVAGNLLASSLYELARQTEDGARQGQNHVPALATQLAGQVRAFLDELRQHAAQD